MNQVSIAIDPGSVEGDIAIIKFEGGGDFEAFNAAKDWCRKNDVAMGRMERDCPIGLMWGAGDHDISKWTNMTRAEQDSLDGRLTGPKRCGPITIALKSRLK